MKVSTLAAITALVCLTNARAISRSECSSDDDCEDALACLGGQCKAPGEEGADCQDDDWCSGTLACIGGKCSKDDGGETICTTDDDCEDALACLGGQCKAPGEEGADCQNDDWCSGTLACIGGKCSKEDGGETKCTTDDDCEGDLVCRNSQCVADNGNNNPGVCKTDDECDGDLVCVNGQCVTDNSNNSTICTVDDDCDGDLICQNGECVTNNITDPCVCDSECADGERCASGVCVPDTPNNNTTGFPASVLSLYHVTSGAIEFSADHGLIEKVQGSGADISTLVTFVYPSDTAGKTCTIVLDFSGATHTIDGAGSQNVDVFSSLYYATHDTYTWPNGNGRNVHLGRVHVVDGGVSTVDQDYGLSFPCPAGETLGYELVPTGDAQHIEWTDLAEGPRVVVS